MLNHVRPRNVVAALDYALAGLGIATLGMHYRVLGGPVSYPPGGPFGPGENEIPQQQQQQPLPYPPPQHQAPQYPGQPQQQSPDAAAYGQPTQPLYPANPYGAPQEPQPPQQAYYPGAPQSPYGAQDAYAQDQGQFQGQQPYGYQYQYPYDPNAVGYGQPMPPPAQGTNSGSRNAMIGALVAVAVVAMGVSVYWFGFHDQPAKTTPIGLSSTLSATVASAPSGSPSPSDQPSASDSATSGTLDTGDTVAQLQALMATMTDPGCRESFQALITFEQAVAADAGDDTALLTDYDTAIASLNDAQTQAGDNGKSDAIGQLVTDWKSLVSDLAGGGSPDDSAMADDVQQLASACLD